MVDIRPFRGVRYDPAKAGAGLENLAAPPYDVISPAEQDALYARHPANVVRLILGREDDKYAQAAMLFREWLESGVLAADDTPSFYVYRQTFSDPATGQPVPERLGLVCLLKLEDYAAGKVLPHEKTLSAPKADRLALLRTTHAQFESIYGLFSDPDSAVRSFIAEYDDRETVIERVDDLLGSTHKIERLADSDGQAVLQELMADKAVFIADGHHRYETALNFQRELRAAPPGGTPLAADFILVTLTAFEDEGLLVLPTHRMIRAVPPEQIAALTSALAENFTLSPSRAEAIEAEIAAQAEAGKTAFGIVLPPGTVQMAVLNAAPLPDAAAVSRLPVSQLEALVLDGCLGISREMVTAGEHVFYTRELSEAVSAVGRGDAQAAFLLGRPTVAEIRDVSLAGDVMPQKSTFFYPKLLSGLVLRDLRLDQKDLDDGAGEAS